MEKQWFEVSFILKITVLILLNSHTQIAIEIVFYGFYKKTWLRKTFI